MPIKKYKPEQIVTLLRQIEVEVANGKTCAPQKIVRSRGTPDLSGGTFQNLKHSADLNRLVTILLIEATV